MSNKKNLFQLLPKVDDLLNSKQIKALLTEAPRVIVVDAIREEIDTIRRSILELKAEDLDTFHINNEILLNKIISTVKEKNTMRLRKVINATGVVLHTNLGRALLSEKIKEKLWDVASSYSNLEFDVSSGKRGSRYSHIEEIVTRLTGAEEALVVNNNAAAVLLVLGTLAKDKEVIISRGQLVEIGGSFRVPEVMEQSGAKLIEVGTTNKTHIRDYEKAIGEATGILLKVHTSNYKILGFTKEVELEKLVQLGKNYNIPVVEDIGSGTLIDLSKYGISKEPTVQESIRAGVDIVTFSGDKLLGGPQAGIIVGKKEYIERMKKNSLTRAFRVDKLTLVALEATLNFYLDEEDAIKNIPTLHMLTMNLDEIRQRADKLYSLIETSVSNYLLEKINGVSQVGGGSLPLEELPTLLISLKPKHISVNKCEEMLRNFLVPIITRIHEDRLLLDVRTIEEKDFHIIIEGLKSTVNLQGE